MNTFEVKMERFDFDTAQEEALGSIEAMQGRRGLCQWTNEAIAERIDMSWTVASRNFLVRKLAATHNQKAPKSLIVELEKEICGLDEEIEPFYLEFG